MLACVVMHAIRGTRTPSASESESFLAATFLRRRLGGASASDSVAEYSDAVSSSSRLADALLSSSSVSASEDGSDLARRPLGPARCGFWSAVFFVGGFRGRARGCGCTFHVRHRFGITSRAGLTGDRHLWRGPLSGCHRRHGAVGNLVDRLSSRRVGLQFLA